MTEAALAGLLPGLAYAFMLVLARVGCAAMLLPGIGESDLPVAVRAGLAVAFVVVLLPVVAPLIPAPPADVASLASRVAAEAVTGLWIGWLARLVALSLPLAGQVISFMLGTSTVLTPDPELGAQSSALGRMFGLAAPALVLASGLYELPIAALAGSYTLVPPGAWVPAADAARGVVAAVGLAFGLALRLAAPFLVMSIVWQAALGVVSRLVPRLQVYYVAMPGQILAGLALLGLLGGTLVAAWEAGLRDAWTHLPGAG